MKTSRRLFLIAAYSIAAYSISNATQHAFTHDNLNQLTAVTYGSTAFGYSYDALGNRLSSTITVPTDTDGDGLSDALEALAGTNPDSMDSDFDGLADASEDANRNGWKDIGETSPTNPDTDNDQMPDGWEVQYSLKPVKDDANEDIDNDGYTNLAEYQAGTNPIDPISKPGGGPVAVPATGVLAILAAVMGLAVVGRNRLNRDL